MEVISSTLRFYRTLVYFQCGGSYKTCPYFTHKDDTQAKVQLYSLALITYLWDKPHYRNGSFQDDMSKNLRNVGIPGTGVPLSVFVRFRPLAYLFLFILYPLIALVSAFVLGLTDSEHTPFARRYYNQLFKPDDWFSFWRLNCRLASLHSYLSSSPGYAHEDKFTFLKEAAQKGIPVTPFEDAKEFVVKDRNEEGGMGISFFRNAVHGGDFIIQRRLFNDPRIAELLPTSAPLSTFRVITASRGGISQSRSSKVEVRALSCVFRAGLSNKNTDHSSVLFDVDSETGRVLQGTSNAHWYKLGLSGLLRFWPRRTSKLPLVSSHDIVEHPDTGLRITGRTIPEIDSILELAIRAHRTMLPAVPLAGWDVALTNEGLLLLEVNLSCNFFRGSFDQSWYFSFLSDYFESLDQARHGALDSKSGNPDRPQSPVTLPSISDLRQRVAFDRRTGM